jgi:hypothetical protein
MEVEETTKAVEEIQKPMCPICDSEDLIIVSHCITCPNCGWGTCSL